MDAVARLNRGKETVLDFFRGAGVPERYLTDVAQRVAVDRNAVSKFEMARTVLTSSADGFLSSTFLSRVAVALDEDRVTNLRAARKRQRDFSGKVVSGSMKIPARRHRLLPAVLAAAAIGGLVAGIVVARGGSSSTRAQGPPGVLAQGKFRSIGWGTNGTASIVREASGRLQLRFSSSFQTQPAPELFVYLAKYEGGRRTEWTQVASLRSAWGPQAYDLPSSKASDLRVSVSIYCAKCNRAWGEAALRPTGAAS